MPLMYICLVLVPHSQIEAKADRIIIKKDLNLKGKVWELEEGSTIVISKGAQISNGRIVFNNTKIDAGKRCFAPDLVLEGSIRDSVNIEWFDIHYDVLFDNSTALSSALAIASESENNILRLLEKSRIYVKSHIDSFDHASNDNIKYLREGTVTIPSNIIFDLNGSEIRCLPNDKAHYNILYSRESHNIVIKNGSVVGDSKTHSYRDGTNEWGYGIELQGVNGFHIENIRCESCTGDGIDIQALLFVEKGLISKVINCKNGIISNCIFENNDRNNMSVQGCDSLVVIKSVFNNANRTAPRAGIDIEPSFSFGTSTNIVIEGCSFENNKTYGVMIHKIAEGVTIRNILIKDCTFSSPNSNYHVFNNGGNNVSLKSCSFLSSVHEPCQVRITCANNTIINDCTSGVNNGISVLLDGKVKACYISDCDLSLLKFHQYQNETELNDIFVTNCNFVCKGIHHCLMEHTSALGKVNAVFDSCIFDYRGAAFTNLSQHAFILPEGNNVLYTMTNCKFWGNGTTIVLTRSLNITESALDRTKLTVNVTNGGIVIFTKNKLTNHIATDHAAIAVFGKSSMSTAGDFTGLRVLSSARPLKSIIRLNKLRDTQIKIDKAAKYGNTDLFQ